MDEIDQAAEVIQNRLNDAIATARIGLTGDCCIWCERCGEKIPKARRDAAPWCRMCLDCQEAAEKLGK